MAEKERKIKTNFNIKPWALKELDRICKDEKLRYGSVVELLITEYLKGK